MTLLVNSFSDIAFVIAGNDCIKRTYPYTSAVIYIIESICKNHALA